MQSALAFGAMEQEMGKALLAQLAFRTPLFIVWLVAIVLALVWWKRHPRVSAFVLAAVVILGAQSFFSAWMTFLPITLTRAGRTHAEVGAIMSAYGLASTFVSAVGWALLLPAIFGWRRAP
jgi:hypothetical protein